MVMKKIASPQDLQAELRSLMSYVHGFGPEGKPDRRVVAAKLLDLADRISMSKESRYIDDWNRGYSVGTKTHPSEVLTEKVKAKKQLKVDAAILKKYVSSMANQISQGDMQSAQHWINEMALPLSRVSLHLGKIEGLNKVLDEDDDY